MLKMLLLIEKVKVLKMLLIKRLKCWRCCWSKGPSAEDVVERSKCWRCCWSKGQYAEDIVADQIVKVLKMLLIERSKCWRCCCWSNSQSAEDVADRKVQVLKMSLLIERSKCWRCCWSKTEDVADDEDWRLKMKTTWCWKASNDLYMCYHVDVDDVPYLFSCCCWCCCRIPFSLRGSVEIL